VHPAPLREKDPFAKLPEASEHALTPFTLKPIIASPQGAAICGDRHVALLLAMTGFSNSGYGSSYPLPGFLKFLDS
jgi:hypothetical protein